MKTLVDHYKRAYRAWSAERSTSDAAEPALRAAYLAGYKDALRHIAGSTQAAAVAAVDLRRAVADATAPLSKAAEKLLDAIPDDWADAIREQ